MNGRQAGLPATDRFSSRGKAIFRLCGLVVLTLGLMPPQICALLLRLPAARAIPRLWHRVAVRIMGWRVVVHGAPSHAPRTLYVANHASYSDIVVLGSLADINFIAKAEVAGWPVFGFLARLHGTMFIERRGAKAAAQRDEIANRLDKGHKLVLFAEGTSNDGIHVQPFKSALFSVVHGAADGPEITLQPVSIAYTRLDGVPVGRTFLSHFAWYGDMTLVPHLLELLGLGSVTIEVTFHEPVDASRFETRRALAEYCHGVVSSGVAASNAGTASDRAAVTARANS